MCNLVCFLLLSFMIIVKQFLPFKQLLIKTDIFVSEKDIYSLIGNPVTSIIIRIFTLHHKFNNPFLKLLGVLILIPMYI